MEKRGRHSTGDCPASKCSKSLENQKKSWEEDDLTNKVYIDEGQFGKVHKYDSKKLRSAVAVKEIANCAMGEHEASVMSKLNNPYIIELHGSFMKNGIASLVLEYADETLSKYFQRLELSDMEKINCIKKFGRQILLGLLYLHEVVSIIHRDIKGQNILLKNNSARISDFGCALVCEEPEKRFLSREQMAGTRFYFAPELFDVEFGFKVDVWSYGVMVFKEMTTQHPFYTCGQDLELALKSGVKGLQEGLLAFPPIITHTPELDFMLKKIFQFEPKRYSAAELLVTKFYTETQADFVSAIPTQEQTDKIKALLKFQLENGSFPFNEEFIKFLGFDYTTIDGDREERKFSKEGLATALGIELINIKLAPCKEENIKEFDRAELYLFKTWASQQPKLTKAAQDLINGAPAKQSDSKKKV